MISNNYISAYKNYPVSFKKNELTNEKALNLLSKELERSMTKQEATNWVEKIKQICQKYNLTPKKLPLNKDYPGSLSKEENNNIFKEIFDHILSKNQFPIQTSLKKMDKLNFSMKKIFSFRKFQ